MVLVFKSAQYEQDNGACVYSKHKHHCPAHTEHFYPACKHKHHCPAHTEHFYPACNTSRVKAGQ